MSATKDGATESYRKTWRGAVYHAIRDHTLPWCWEKESRMQRHGAEREACGGDPEHVHHIVPPAAGGTSTRGNLMVLCGPCHRGAHDLIRGVAGFQDVIS